MIRLLYGLALLCFAMGIADASEAWAVGRRELQAEILMLLMIVFAALGFALSRVPTKKCVHCGERTPKNASVCRHCGRSPNRYRRFYPSN